MPFTIVDPVCRLMVYRLRMMRWNDGFPLDEIRQESYTCLALDGIASFK